MPMTTYSGTTNTISTIGTTVQERGLTTDQFKAKFDANLAAFVVWFNGTHKTEFDAYVADVVTRKTEFDAHVADIAQHGTIFNQALINGNFDIAQRGTTFDNPNNLYALDRWYVEDAADLNVKIMQSTTIPNSKSKYSLRAEVMTATGGVGAYTNMSQQIENFSFLAGQTVTLSCMVKCDAGATAMLFVDDGATSTQSSLFSGTTWTLVTVTKTIVSANTRLKLTVRFTRAGLDVGVGVNFSQAKLNIGTLALPFSPKSVAQELQDCKRYFQQRSIGTIAAIDLSPSMRITPTITGSVSPFNYVAEL